MSNDNPGIVVFDEGGEKNVKDISGRASRSPSPSLQSHHPCDQQQEHVLSLKLQLPHHHHTRLGTISDDSDWSVDSDYSDSPGYSAVKRRTFSSRSRSPDTPSCKPPLTINQVESSTPVHGKSRNRQSFTDFPRVTLNHILHARGKKTCGSAPTSPVSDHRYCPLSPNQNALLSPSTAAATITFDDANNLSDSGTGKTKSRSLKSGVGKAFRNSFKTRRKSGGNNHGNDRSLPLSSRPLDEDGEDVGDHNGNPSIFDFTTGAPSIGKLIKAGKSRIKSRSSVDEDEVGLYLSLVMNICFLVFSANIFSYRF